MTLEVVGMEVANEHPLEENEDSEQVISIGDITAIRDASTGEEQS